MKRNLGASNICAWLLSSSVDAAGSRTNSTAGPEYSGAADTARFGQFCLPSAGRPLSGIYRRALLALAVILAAAGGCLSPVFAQTTVSSNYIQNLSLDVDPLHTDSHAVSKIAVSGSYVHVVWISYNVADWSGKSLYYRRSTDGGKTFETPILLVPKDTSLEFDQKYNSVVADGAYLHIFYTVGWPRKLNYIRSADNGGTFDPVVTLSSGYYGYDVYATAENGNVAVGWTLNGTNDGTGNPKALYSTRSSDGGATFSTTTVAFNDASHNPGIYYHSIVDAVRTGNHVYFLTVMQDENWSSTQSHLYLWASTDGGATFKTPQKVNVKAVNDGYYATTIQAVYSPNLAASGNEVNIVWVNNDNPGAFDGWVQYSLRTRRSTDAGTTLEDPVTLHTFPGGYNQGGYPGQETIARIGNRVHVVTEKRDAPAGTFLWTSNDGGASWGTEQRISTGGWYPHIKLDATRVHIANSWYFRSADAGVRFDGGVNPHDAARSWDYWSMVLGADGAAHYIGCAGGASCAYDGQIMYRRIAPEPAPGTTDKVLHMTTTGNSRIENLQIAATPDINFSSAMTIELWVKRMTDNAYYLENMISKSRASGNVGSYVISYRNDYTIYSRIITTETSTAWLGSGVSLPLGTWTHIAMTYDANGGADNWKIYVNGNLANKATVSGTIVTETPNSPLNITSSSNGAAYPGQVEIDELRLWNTARTLTEIQTGMGQSLSGKESGLTAYYNFNDTFKDITGRGNDAVPMYFENFIDSSIIPREKTLSVTTSDHGMVSVNTGTLAWNGSTGTALYPNGTRVTLTATPDPGFSFYGWSGACTGTGSCMVTMNWEKSVAADFILTGDINNDGSVTLMDAILALQVVSGVTPATSLGKWGDVNGDGKIGLAEAIFILQRVAGIRQNASSGGTFTLASTVFTEGATIPTRYTYNLAGQCAGENVSPALAWTNSPANTQSFAIIMHDPDGGNWVHWVQFNIPAGMTSLAEAAGGPDVGVKGLNDFGGLGYGGPCPPSGNHHYIFTLYALDAELNLTQGATRGQVNTAMAGHILGQVTLTGLRSYGN